MIRRSLLPLVAGLCALPILVASAALPERDAALHALEYIRSTQQADGGFSGPAHGPGHTMDAILAIRSAGVDPSTLLNGSESPRSFLEANVSATDSPAAAAKAALAASALGLDPADVAGVDLIADIEVAYDPATGRYAADDFSNSLAVLGLVCTGVDVPGAVAEAIRGSQLDDGGWGFSDSGDPDTTAIALQALLAGGGTARDAHASAALAFLQEHQGLDGGWGFDPAESNVNSTAFVVQALLAAGEDPESAAYLEGSATPIDYLLSQQQDDGSFPGFDAAVATNQAIPALMGRTYCNAPSTPLVDAPAPTATPTTAPSLTPTAVPTLTPTSAPTLTPTATATSPAPLPPDTGSGSAGAAGVWTAATGLTVTTLSLVAIRASRRQAR